MLETINIQYTNEHLSLTCSLTALTRKTLVDNRDEPLEQTGIYELRDTVPNDERL